MFPFERLLFLVSLDSELGNDLSILTMAYSNDGKMTRWRKIYERLTLLESRFIPFSGLCIIASLDVIIFVREGFRSYSAWLTRLWAGFRHNLCVWLGLQADFFSSANVNLNAIAGSGRAAGSLAERCNIIFGIRLSRLAFIVLGKGVEIAVEVM